ncbi:MAG: porin [Gammaproteobacteria bacterium]|nr:MAG: porin [Gammaproteobacteria bacterium]
MQPRKSLLALTIGLLCASSQASAITLEELAERLEKVEKENAALRAQLNQTTNQVETNTTAVETVADNVSNSGIVKAAEWVNKTTIGAYGELHYNNLSGKGGASDKDEIDFHRFVLFFGHEFTDDIRFFSELELEHSIAGDGKKGEIELEQAYLDFDLNDKHTARAGLFLIPVGIINETHEPPTFYGTERNPVEKNIIPATWWEAGAGAYGQLGGGFSYDAYIHSGLATTSGNNFAVRKGRQKASKAKANDLAATGRIKYTGIAGLELAFTAQYQEDISQISSDGADSANMFETHAVWTTGPFTLKALYAMWDIEGSAVKAVGADKQDGFYLEPSFKINSKLGIFARYNQWDNQAGSNSGEAKDTSKEQWDIGVNWWPHEDVVIKADYQRQNHENRKDQNGVNLGIGYQF